MNIIKQKWEFLNPLISLAPRKISLLFHFGAQTLVARNIISFRANARIVKANWHTAKSKVCRLMNNTRIPQVFITILKSLNFISKDDIIVIDFSDFGNGMQVLMFARQTEQGRAFPVYFEILRYPITEEGSQNIFVVQAIQNFSTIAGCKPKLVFDRGFASPYIIKKLLQYKYIFYLRIKKRKLVAGLKDNRMFKACDSADTDNLVRVYDTKLRLVISDAQAEQQDPWYLITNDFVSSRENVIDIYYHRFEIEEFFRDAKHLLGLEYLNCRKILSLQIALWFAILGTWFLWYLERQMTENDKKAQSLTKLSVIRYWLEYLHREMVYALEGEFMEVYGV